MSTVSMRFDASLTCCVFLQILNSEYTVTNREILKTVYVY